MAFPQRRSDWIPPFLEAGAPVVPAEGGQWWYLFGPVRGMFKNTASQKIVVLVIDVTTNAPKTGDAANLTVYVSKDDGAVTVLGDTTATELDATNAKGLYSFDLTQAETNADKLNFSGKSSTADVQVIPKEYYTLPPSFASITIANGAVDADIERLQGSVIATPSIAGVIEADVTHWLGTAAATPTVAGVPEVDVTHFNGTAGTFASGRPEVNTSHIAGSAVSTTSAQIGVNVVQISTDATAADRLEAWLDGMVTGTADSGSTTTIVDTERTEADADYWKGSLVLFTSGTIIGQCRLITAFNAGTDTITFAPATTQAVSTNTYIIIPAGRADVELWDGSAVNALISGRVDANAQVVGTGAIVAGSFAAGAIDATAIATGAIDADAIADNAIDAGAIAADAITAAKIADNAIDAGAIATGAITSAKFAAGAIDAAAIATGAIDADALASDAVTEIRSIVSGTADSGSTTTMVDAARTEADTDYWKGKYILFTSGTISGQCRLITAFTPGTDTITFAPATTQAVGTNTYEILPSARADIELWDGSAVNALISGRVDANTQAMANDVITAAVIATGAVDADAIADNAIDAGAIAADAITAAKIADNAIDAASIATGAITTAKFAAGAIDAAALATDAANEIRDAVWAKAMAELSSVPGVTGSVLEALEWVFLLSRNKITQTATTQLLRNDADSATIGTSTVSDDATTFTRGEFS